MQDDNKNTGQVEGDYHDPEVNDQDQVSQDQQQPQQQDEFPDQAQETTEPAHDSSESVAPVDIAPSPMVASFPTKKSKKPLFIALVAIVAVALLGAVFWFIFMKGDSDSNNQANDTNGESTVLRLGVAPGLLEGTVEYSEDGSTWQKLASDTDLAQGNHIRTLASSRAVLLVDDGSAVRLGSNSEVELTDLSVTNVVISNISGEVYTRVTASTTRTFAVSASNKLYTAKGTAYRTLNTSSKKGVEVYHSKVGLEDSTDVTEGNAFFTLSDQKEKENVVSAIDLSALKKDEFIKWNSEQDKKEAEFANSLGVLVELDKPDPTPPPVTPPSTSNTPSNGISLSGSVSEYSAVFSWSVRGVDTSQGFKLVKSKTSQTPTYPDNTAAYIESGKTSYNLYLGDGKTYYFRICAYRGSSCESYSNTVTVTTPLKEVEKPTAGGITLVMTGNVASWTYGGTAPHGFKLVISAIPGIPYYGNADKTKFTGSPHEINYLEPGTYNIRVCKYTASEYEGGCMDYSNQLTYTES